MLWLESNYFSESYWWDRSKYCNNGVVHGAKWKGNAFYFNGSGNYVDCGNHESLDITDGITIEVWIKAAITQPQANARIVTKAESGDQYHLFLAAGNPYIYLAGVTNGTLRDTTHDLRDNLWHHVVGTYNGIDTIKIYVDGVESASRTDASGTITSTDSKVYIGWDGGGIDFFRGNVAIARVFEGGLSEEEIKILYRTTYRRI